MPSSRPERRPTMADVAAHAGVSLKSVSRVVNGEPHVSAALSERVNGAIAQLGFRPHTSARQLAGGVGRLIGFVQIDAANPFFAAVHRGLEDVARAAGYLVLSGSTDADPAREAAVIEAFIEARVAGMVVAAAEGSDALLRQEISLGTAVVCVDRLLSDADVDTVVSDNRDSTATAIGRLLRGGHRRIAFLGGKPGVWTADERLAGYRDALAEASVEEPRELVVRDVGAVSAAAEATRRLLEGPRPPSAIFAAQDRIGIGVIQALHALGRQHDVAVIVFDDIPMAEQLQPSVSVISQDPYEMGRRAGQLLLRRLARAGEAHLDVVPTRHVVRASTEISPH